MFNNMQIWQGFNCKLDSQVQLLPPELKLANEMKTNGSLSVFFFCVYLRWFRSANDFANVTVHTLPLQAAPTYIQQYIALIVNR